MARLIVTAVLGATVLLSGTALADEPGMDTGADLTGVDDSETGEHVVPGVEAVTSPAPQPVDEPDLTVESPRVQVFEPYGVFDQLAQCEASGDWHNASNRTYKGGLQFDAATWARHGGLDFAWRADFATREQQIIVGRRTQASQGWGAWPYCSRKLGLR